jgi:hypothetical protein
VFLNCRYDFIGFLMILLGGTFVVVLLTFVPLLDEIEVSMKLLVCSEICVSTLKG